MKSPTSNSSQPSYSQNLPLVNTQSVFHAPSMYVNKTSSAIVKSVGDDLLENWDTKYSAIDYPPPKMFGVMPIDRKLNQQIPFEKLDERPKIKALVVLLEEIFPYLSIDRIALLYKRRKGDGFQKWHQDYKLGAGQITKTIVITLTSIHNTTPQLARQLATKTTKTKCDYDKKYMCLLKTKPPDRCSFGLCDRAVHHKCQMSWRDLPILMKKTNMKISFVVNTIQHTDHGLKNIERPCKNTRVMQGVQ